MGVSLFYAGFETCFWPGPPAPKVLGSDSILQYTVARNSLKPITSPTYNILNFANLYYNFTNL